MLSKAEKIRKQARKQQKRMEKSSLKKFMQVACLAGALTIGLTGNALALPTDGQITQGQGTITQSGQQMTIDQASNNLNLNWQSFNIGSGETVKFNQPSVNSVAINNILGNQASEIYGNLTANGKVFLINPNGILFGKTAQVDVGGLVASTLKMENQSSNSYSFTGNSGRIVNQGNLTGKQIALLSPEIVNQGLIVAKEGTAALGAGEKITLDFQGDGLINLAVDKGAVQAQIDNQNLIQADGGQVIMSAKAAQDMAGTVINNSGIIQAQGLRQKDGKILLDGGESGIVQNSGKLDVSGKTGGSIKVLGEKVGISGTIDALGENGGGEILLGGNYQGKGPEHNATYTYVDKTAQIKAGATQTGDAGKVVVWADDSTQFYGTISATSQNGQGGTVETSGKKYLTVGGTVDASSKSGQNGSWLLDPYNVNIVAGTVSSLSSGQFTSGASNQQIGANVIQNALNGGTDVTIQTGTGGTEDGNINVNSAINYNSNNSLTLKAHNDINVNRNISNSGNGKIVLRSDSDADKSGTVIFAPGTNISTGGDVEIYYNPTDRGNYTPTDYSSYLTAATKTAYMLVNDYTDLNNIRNNFTGAYALGKDIDASASITEDYNGFIYQGFEPISLFRGKFNGDNHVIRDLYINRAITPYIGLFGYLNTGSQVENLGLVNGNITGAEYVGALAGSSNSGTISNCYNTGTVSGNDISDYIGGLVGYSNGGQINNCYNTGAVSGSSYVGGLVGQYDAGEVSKSYNTGAVSGSSYVGGLVGWNNNTGTSSTGIITDSYNNGTVTFTDSVSGIGFWIGGLVGENYGGKIVNSYNTGTVSAIGINPCVIDMVGGLVGLNDGGIISESYNTGVVSASGADYVGGLVGSNYLDWVVYFPGGNISNSYSTGAVSGGDYVGGLVGYNTGTINTSYSAGAISASGSIWGGSPQYVGGLLGLNSSGTVNASYWDITSSGMNNGVVNIGGSTAQPIGLTTDQMKMQGNFGTPSSPWDFTSTWYIGNNLYPKLRTIPLTISGRVDNYTDQTVRLISGGNILATITPNSNGVYTYQIDPLTTIFDGNSKILLSVDGYSGADLIAYTGDSSRADLTENVLGINCDASNNILATTKGGQNIDLFNVVGNDLIVNGSLINKLGTTYTLGGNVVTTGNQTYNGAVNINTDTTLKSNGDININGKITGTGKIVLRADSDANSSGTVNFTSGGTVTTGGDVDIYYNPGDKVNYVPTDYSGNVNASNLNAYMLVNDYTDLNNVRNNLSGIYALGKDIDASVSATEDYNGSIYQGFVPIADSSSFTGNFNGDNHVISNLYMNRPDTDCVGLFSYVDTGAQISNLGLINGNITGHSDVGSLAGDNFGQISNSYSIGPVSGIGSDSQYVGGLVGYNGGQINNSYNAGTVSGHDDVGGLVGYIDSSIGTISTSYNIGAVSGTNNVGGLVGESNSGQISTSYNTGIVIGIDRVGGLIGYNSGDIGNSYNTGAVNGTNEVGGLIGEDFMGTITNTYSTGAVTGNSDVGGLVGYDDGGTISSSYWDTETSGQNSSAGGNPLTTASMKVQGNFSGWDFNNIWYMKDNLYPKLRNIPVTILGRVDNYTGQTVRIISGGNVLATITPNSNGIYTYQIDPLSTSFDGNSKILLDGYSGADLISYTGDSSIADLAENILAINCDASNAILAGTKGNQTLSLFSVDAGNNLNVSGDFRTKLGTIYTLDGNIATTGNQTYNGGINVASNAILQSGGNIALGVVEGNSNNLEVNANNINLNGQLNALNNLNLMANTAAIQTGAINAGSLSLNGTGDYILDNASNNVNTLTATNTGDITYRDSNGFTIGGIGTNNLTLTAGGAVTQTGIIRAGQLSLNGMGSYLLENINNNVNTLIANTGSVNYADTDDLNVSTITSTGAVTVKGAGNLTLDAPISAGGDVTLKAGNNFTNNAGTNAITFTQPDKRWLICSNSWNTINKGGLTSDFRRYNVDYMNSLVDVPATGNGFIYYQQPELSVNVTNTGGISSDCGSEPTANLIYSVVGTLADDEDNFTNIGLGGTVVYTTTLSKATNEGSYNIGYAGGLTSTAGYKLISGATVPYTVKGNKALNDVVSNADNTPKDNTVNPVQPELVRGELQGEPPIELVDGGVKPFETLPATITLSPLNGQSVSYTLAVVGDAVTLRSSIPTQNNQSVPVIEHDITLVTVESQGTQTVNNCFLSVGNGSVTISGGTGQATQSLPPEPTNQGVGEVFTVSGADGKLAEFKIIYDEKTGAISIKPLNDQAAAMAQDQGANKKIVAATGILTLKEKRNVEASKIGTVYISTKIANQ